MTKVIVDDLVKKDLKWYKSVKHDLDLDLYDDSDLSDLWDKIYNTAVELENKDMDDFDVLDADINNYGDIEDGWDMSDFATEQANEAHDFVEQHMYSVAASKIHDRDMLYIMSPDDPSDVEPATDSTISEIVDDIISDLENY